MSVLKWKPSPALLVAALAVSIALVGTAVAGPSAEISLNKNERRITAKIARQLSLKFIKRFTPLLSDRQITQRAPGLSVANAENADNAENAENAVNAENADNAENAVNAENAGPPAFARVLSAGEVDEDNSKNVQDSNVTRSGNVYCFNDLGFKPRHVQATVEWLGGLSDAIIHASVGDSGTCPGAEDASARIYDPSAATAVSRDFYISFDR